MKLFVNRLSYCEQSPYGDHRYHRLKHLSQTLAGRRAAMELAGQKWGLFSTFSGQARFTSNSCSSARSPSPDRGLMEKIVEQHLAGEITINMYAINPETQC